MEKTISTRERTEQIKEKRKNTPRTFRKGGFTIGDAKILGDIKDYADLSGFGLSKKALEKVNWDMFIQLVNNRIIDGPDINDDTEIDEFHKAISFLVISSEETQ